jgi:hypothetical protein
MLNNQNTYNFVNYGGITSVLKPFGMEINRGDEINGRKLQGDRRF